jgi:hypothetical protein
MLTTLLIALAVGVAGSGGYYFYSRKKKPAIKLVIIIGEIQLK